MIEVVYTVCSSDEEAKSIGKTLVEERLCACVNIIPGVQSIYHWEGKIVEDKEAVLIIKSVKGSFDGLAKRVLELHSYDVPAIFSLESNNVGAKYLNWIKKEVVS